MTNEETTSALGQATTQTELQALINATPGVSLLIDLEGTVLCANARATTHFGIARDQLIGCNVYSLFDDATSLGRRASVRQAELLCQPVVLEDERAGMYFRHSLVPAMDSDGAVRRVAVFTEDITERKKAEMALRASEERFRFLAENTVDVVWELDPNMRFIYINGADERLRGFAREEVIGRSVLELFTPEGQAIIAQHSAQRRAAERLGKVEPQLVFQAPQIRKDGTSYWTEVSSTTSYDLAGNVAGYNGITRNIDASKQHEKKLEEANRQLQLQLSEIVELQTQLKEQAVRDPLTRLHNRRYMDETLPRELARAKRQGYPLALIMVDLDHFKRVNDTYGHPTGDAVLQAMATILLQGAREGDIICRYGGEEFLVVLPNMTIEQALGRAMAWQRTLGQTAIQHGVFTVQVTLSAGISAFPDNSSHAEGLLRLADESLYRAKGNGRNRVETASTSVL